MQCFIYVCYLIWWIDKGLTSVQITLCVRNAVLYILCIFPICACVQVVFFPTTAEKSCEVFTVVCDNCQVKDISIEGKSSQWSDHPKSLVYKKRCFEVPPAWGQNVSIMFVFPRWGPADCTWACVCIWEEGASCGGRGAWPHCRPLCPFQPM